VYIHRVEAKLLAPMTLPIGGEPRIVNWIGFIDRIDRVGNSYRLVDYKSGRVKTEDVTYKQKETVTESFKACKHALQLATYAFLFNYNYNKIPETMGIYAIQRKTEAFFPLQLPSSTTHELLADFQALITEVVTQIFDENQPFTHSDTAKYCGYC
jgi:hypothetical protein